MTNLVIRYFTETEVITSTLEEKGEAQGRRAGGGKGYPEVLDAGRIDEVRKVLRQYGLQSL